MSGEPGQPTREGARPHARPRHGRRLPAALAGARLQARVLGDTARAVDRAPAVGTPDELARERHALLVTYRRDGTPVATPVWAALGGGCFYVRSERASGKVKRLAGDARALLAPCTARGRPRGAPLRVRGRVLGEDEELAAERALEQRYGAVRALFERTMDGMGVDMCYLELLPLDSPQSE